MQYTPPVLRVTPSSGSIAGATFRLTEMTGTDLDKLTDGNLTRRDVRDMLAAHFVSTDLDISGLDALAISDLLVLLRAWSAADGAQSDPTTSASD
jgi:hypothetical protein